jgi:hypothetical protein
MGRRGSGSNYTAHLYSIKENTSADKAGKKAGKVVLAYLQAQAAVQRCDAKSRR